MLAAKRQAQQIALDAFIQASGGAYKPQEQAVVTAPQNQQIPPTQGSPVQSSGDLDIEDLIKQYGGGQ